MTYFFLYDLIGVIILGLFMLSGLVYAVDSIKKIIDELRKK